MKLLSGKAITTVLIYLTIILITLELSPFIIGSIILREGYSRKSARDELALRAGMTSTGNDSISGRQEGYLSEHIVHPYLGFVHKEDPNYNEYGFPGPSPLLKGSDSVINICITGGSVAKQLYQFSGQELLRLLQADKRFAGKKINLVSLALGGFKQPQQLMALNYFLSLGAQYDYVINLDGFNEVVLPYSDNMPFGIFPAFPRHWNVYSRKVLPRNTILLLGKQARTKEQQQLWSEFVLNSPLRFSNFGLFLWKIRDQSFTHNILASEVALREELAQSEAGIQTQGPGFGYGDTSFLFAYQASYWAQCSRQMNALAEHSGFDYIHLLQPNQYLDGSKQLTEEELRIAFEEGDFAYKEAVREAYPMLIGEGSHLKDEGVNFIDLTGLFANESSTIYSDKCCHFNKKGYDAIVKKIAGVITSGD